MPSLNEVALQELQHVCDLDALDALGDDLEPEVVSKLNGRLDDEQIVFVGPHVLHERPVDLDRVDGESFQGGQRRVTGSEVIDCKSNAETVQRRQCLHGSLRIRHDAALGDLEFKPNRVDFPLL